MEAIEDSSMGFFFTLFTRSVKMQQPTAICMVKESDITKRFHLVLNNTNF